MRIKNNEANEQAAFFQYAEHIKELKWMHSSLNGAFLAGDKKQRAIQMNKLKTQGMKKGVLDIFLPKLKGVYGGMYIEMKFGKNKMTDEQKEFAADLSAEGYCMFTCYNAGEAIEAVKIYLKLEEHESIISTCPYLSIHHVGSSALHLNHNQAACLSV